MGAFFGPGRPPRLCWRIRHRVACYRHGYPGTGARYQTIGQWVADSFAQLSSRPFIPARVAPALPVDDMPAGAPHSRDAARGREAFTLLDYLSVTESKRVPP